MANSTARKIVNDALEGSGLAPISSDAAYIDPTQLDKYQRQTTIFLNLIQGRFGIAFNKRFNNRQFSFNTVAPAPLPMTTYTIPATIVEGFKANSFFNVTANGVNNAPLDVMTHQLWRELYPTPELYAPGIPRYIVPYTEDGSNLAKITVWPYADAVYTIEGICRLIVSPITAGTDQIIFPYWYEHCLVTTLMGWLETRTNEGREGVMLALADQCVQEVMRDATGAYEENELMDIGIRLYGSYNSDILRDGTY